MAKNIFKYFLIFLTFLNVSSITFAQDVSNEKSRYVPQVGFSSIVFDKISYSTGEEVKGSFMLVNKQSVDIGNVYYEIALTGKDSETNSYRDAYYFSERLGPFFVPANSSVPVDYVFVLPNKKPTSDLALRFETFLKNDFRLGRFQKPIDIEGEVVPMLIINSPEIKIAGESRMFLQKNTIYPGEEANFVYTISNSSDSSVKVEPRVVVTEIRHQDNVYANYSEQYVTIPAKSSVQVSTKARIFEDDPGEYAAQIKLIDENEMPRAVPIVFAYVVDGDILTIESLSTDVKSAEGIKKGDSFDVIIAYRGKPFDGRNPDRSLVISNAVVSVNVKDSKNRLVAESSLVVNLDQLGNIRIPLDAQRRADGFIINVKVSKDGKVLSEEVLDVPASPKDHDFSFYSVLWAVIALVFVSGLVFVLKKKAKIFMFMFFIAPLVFGGGVELLAYSPIYSISPPDYPNMYPYNPVFTVTDGIGQDATASPGAQSGSYLTITGTVSMPMAPGGSAVPQGSEQWANGQWVFTQRSGFSGGRPGDYWFDGLEAWYAVPGECNEYACDESNLDYWGSIANNLSNGGGYSCSSTSCDIYFGGSLAAPFSEPTGSFPLFLYFRNDNYISDCHMIDGGEIVCEEFDATGATLIEETINYYDPYEIVTGEAYCYASVEGEDGAIASSASIGQEVTWNIVPEEYVSEYNSCGWIGDNSYGYCINGSFTNLENVRFAGEVSSSTVSLGPLPSMLSNYASNPGSICQYYQPYESLYPYEYNSSSNQCCATSGESCVWDEYLEQDVCTAVTDCRALPSIDTSVWGTSITSTYATATLPADGIANVSFQYVYGDDLFFNMSRQWMEEEPWYTGPWGSISCLPLTVGQDLCSNIDGVQANIPAGFDVYPEVESVGTGGISYADLYCFPVSLAMLEGNITLTADPVLIDVDGTVTWSFEIADSFFEGILDSVLYTIPRFATVTWSGDINDNTGGSQSSSFKDLLVKGLLTNDNDISASYSATGDASVTVTIEDPFVTLSDTAIVTVGQEECVTECEPCVLEEGEEYCDNENPNDNPGVDTFTINPSVANTNNLCTLTWSTNENVKTCELNGVSVATSTTPITQEVSPGVYVLSCVNYAPELVTVGPLTCLSNPDFKED